MEGIEKIYAPSKYIKDFLEEKGWTQADLALVLGWLPIDVSNLILRKKKLTPEVAKRLATVFEKTNPEFWTAIEAKFVLSQSDEIDEKFIRRSELFKRFPVIEMMKRGWINKTNDIEELTSEVLNFFKINSLSETPTLPHAARKSSHYASTTIEQFAWMFRAYTLAPAVMVKTFSTAALDKALEQIKLLSQDADEIRHIPKILAEAGIRLIIIEPVPGSKIDGVALWLDRNSPVIVLSLRFDRIDSFWHTLLHELAHVRNRDGLDFPIIDEDMFGDVAEDRPEIERHADHFASHFFIPEGKLEHFIARVHPLYSDVKIQGFAARWQVHAGIVVGQLHHKHRLTGKGIPFSHQRKFLEGIREIVTGSALTDGYGHRPLI